MIGKSKYILKLYSIYYTLTSNPNVQKISLNVTKILCFFLEHQLITVLLSFRNSCTSWSTKLCGNFHFRFRLVFTKLYIFAQQKAWTNFFQNKNHRKATHSFASRHLIFKLQQELWEFKNICVSWSSLKTDLETNFLNF